MGCLVRHQNELRHANCWHRAAALKHRYGAKKAYFFKFTVDARTGMRALTEAEALHQTHSSKAAWSVNRRFPRVPS